MAPDTSNLIVTHNGDGHVLLSGVLDAHTSSELQSALDGLPQDQSVTLNLEAVSFVDSSGLRTIIAAHQRLGATNHELQLQKPSHAFTTLIEIAGLSEVLHIK